MILISGLVLAALVLIFFEVILPGGILGLLALACIVAATWLGFAGYGALGGALTLLGSLVAVGLLVFIEFKLMANSKWGKGFFLGSSVSGHSNIPQGEDSIVGMEATAITRLNPSGKIAIDGRSYEAYSQDGYIDSGESVVVTKRDNFKLIIKKS
ncbi:MAG TPA: NfeD family protein [Opitutales bacterium]|nr:NfeD family protein [Opitutales bacterium]